MCTTGCQIGGRAIAEALVECLSAKGVCAEATVSTERCAKVWVGRDAIVWIYAKPPRAVVKVLRGGREAVVDSILVCLAFLELEVEYVEVAKP